MKAFLSLKEVITYVDHLKCRYLGGGSSKHEEGGY